MKIPVAFATEYYWDASHTARGQAAGIMDANPILEDLMRRYHVALDRLEVPYLVRAGNTATEYLDSAPGKPEWRGKKPDGKTIRARLYEGQVDHHCLNEFVLLSARESSR
jgi:hypothetical protein